jgi:hypothetical protein
MWLAFLSVGTDFTKCYEDTQWQSNYPLFRTGHNSGTLEPTIRSRPLI